MYRIEKIYLNEFSDVYHELCNKFDVESIKKFRNQKLRRRFLSRVYNPMEQQLEDELKDQHVSN